MSHNQRQRSLGGSEAPSLIEGNSRAGEERLIGGDTGLAAVMARARLVSRSNAPVLLFGETGTGKEISHARSTSTRRFAAVRSAASTAARSPPS